MPLTPNPRIPDPLRNIKRHKLKSSTRGVLHLNRYSPIKARGAGRVCPQKNRSPLASTLPVLECREPKPNQTREGGPWNADLLRRRFRRTRHLGGLPESGWSTRDSSE
ncbi:hypothetical protein CDAR_606611 [Caerostris darwini]|uniref:Uncharacterized protein n=1 Tax=Caerostris darwini TaxID=1538125 RepID=A0AAV4P9D3_9ARAC|nr:hypothetical protein CDAR_606611 [Caerostris darwini]